MSALRPIRTCVTLLAATVCLELPLAHAAALYENDFQKAALDSVPEDFLVLDGQFAVKQEGDNRFLELPGAPLETFGVVFGPSAPDGLCVTARFRGSAKGRRFPVFAVSLGGVSGHKLQVNPARKTVELLKGDDVIASAPYEWSSERWTHLRLQIRKVKDGAWKVEGRAWGHEAQEPAVWGITADLKEAPVGGRPGIWGKPFSGTPIGFDDLRVESAAG